MAQTAAHEETHLLDSLLHTNIKRVIVGAICGIASGILLLALSTLFTPAGSNKIWWLQMMATFCHGGGAMSFDVSQSVLMAGIIFHFGLSILNGLIFGKMTTSSGTLKLMGFGLVLGGLCWLASNMFAPDFLDIEALHEVAQWTRVFLFVSFGVSLGFFMSMASKILGV